MKIEWASVGNSWQCLCETCLHGRTNAANCEWGGCGDNYRVMNAPYNMRYPERTPRTGWSNWAKPLEQCHWCRGGMFYPITACDGYVEIDQTQTRVEPCLRQNVIRYQDGSIRCGLLECRTCEECYKEFMERMEEEENVD